LEEKLEAEEDQRMLDELAALEKEDLKQALKNEVRLDLFKESTKLKRSSNYHYSYSRYD